MRNHSSPHLSPRAARDASSSSASANAAAGCCQTISLPSAIAASMGQLSCHTAASTFEASLALTRRVAWTNVRSRLRSTMARRRSAAVPACTAAKQQRRLQLVSAGLSTARVLVKDKAAARLAQAEQAQDIAKGSGARSGKGSLGWDQCAPG